MKNIFITVMFVVYILIFSVGSLVLADREFSEMENRNLAQFPKVSVENILNGEFSEDFEKYMSDQVIFKDWLVKLKVEENLALGIRKINGVYFGDDEMLIQEYSGPGEQLDKNIEFINEFVRSNDELKFTFMLIPNACYIYGDKLPEFADENKQDEVMEDIKQKLCDNINVVDVSNNLVKAQAESENLLYYRTDHHWTSDGAYIGYTELCKQFGLEATPLTELKYEVICDDFYGSMYSNAPTYNQSPDEITLYSNPKNKCTVEYLDTGVTTESLYNYDNLKKKDKYTFFMDGNHSLIRITSNKIRMNPEQEVKKLIIIKDSYANCMIPMLTDQFEEIYVVDLRYYHESVSELATKTGIDNIVFINNLEFLSTDNNFLWLW